MISEAEGEAIKERDIASSMLVEPKEGRVHYLRHSITVTPRAWRVSTMVIDHSRWIGQIVGSHQVKTPLTFAYILIFNHTKLQ